ncbi:helicase [[Phormidium ambiguum] IAM M-71]|uniref:Helicase n=1 Tax=[Phormidium ambiguum] IAM M-71 TaxID=454136 RepID=A0A1U7IHI1_9CYAN|nr:helicase-related protein [Phormidium ambiguum]OKH36591.1 helicase [Phormidium ambiguum IAM M-71]
MIAANLGRLFEVGFNIGILAYIEQHKLKHNFGDLYQQDLQNLKFSEMLKRILDKKEVISPESIENIEKWSLFLLQKGFLSGLNFMGEYIQSTGWRKTQLANLKILYCQCSFCEENSMKTYSKTEQQEYHELLSQFAEIDKQKLGYWIDKYTQKGEFLKADTLVLLQNNHELRIIAVDLSIFSVKSAQDLLNLEDENLQNQRRLLRREINYLRSKSVFSKLRIDTGNKDDLGFDFSPHLTRYLTAFKREDKESAKLIQAASYTESFYRFLQESGILKDENSVVFNVVGYSDRTISAISLRPENINLLKTCSQIYKNEPEEQDIAQARQQVLELIKLNAIRSFNDGRKFVNQLLEIPTNTTKVISHAEKIEGFSSTLDLRKPHAELIKQALYSDKTYIFLTGNPGIGKTTAIVDFLTENINEGFLFFYVSPRTQVNLDIIEKFKDTKSGELVDDRLFCINTNSQIIKENSYNCVVNYYSNQYQNYFQENAVHFLDINQEIEPKGFRHPLLQRTAEDELRATNKRNKGVLSCLCEAINTVITRQISNHIVATACIQALRITANGTNTLTHFENIFKSAINKKDGQVIPSEMKKISQRIKHLFIMVDEITGDDSGVEFLNGISRILNRYNLTNSLYGFNTKVIVADASIVDPNVIQQHLTETSPEPDKIFFRRAYEQSVLPLSQLEFEFKRKLAIAINANSYPAKSLTINYKVFVESVKFDEDTFAKQSYQLTKAIQAQIVQDLTQLWSNPNSGQILVYIQDKRRLQELIEQIKQFREFIKNQDYLEIHANLSDNDQKEIQQYKNQVKVVFMTSSASRGLSFPKAKHILVEIPRFRVESNLMEVIQVIYRGRGLYAENGEIKTLDNEDKELSFYLCDRAVYYNEDKELSLKESIINILNILLIVKTCVLTRIQGYGQLGREKFLMIPIGGKSISAAGQSFSGQISHLIKDLKKEHNRRQKHQILSEVYTSLENLLSRAEFVLNPKNPVSEVAEISTYLELRELFNLKFSHLLKDNFTGLLKFGNIEPGIINGSLLIVPICDRKLTETYEIRLMDILTHRSDEIIKKMLIISHNSDYPGRLRSAIKNAIELLDKLRNNNGRTQFFHQQDSQDFDQYYALPLFSFISAEAMSKYFANEPEEAEEEEERFRNILSTYINHIYPTDKTLPIGYKYKEFPFIVFSSYSLEQMRQKIFTDKYLLTSNELNVLNLILSQKN